MYFFIARHDVNQPNLGDFGVTRLDDNTGVLILRPALFFHEGQKITMGKLREFFTENAITRFEADGFIKTVNNE